MKTVNPNASKKFNNNQNSTQQQCVYALTFYKKKHENCKIRLKIILAGVFYCQ